MTVLVKFQIEIRFSIELHGNSKLSMTSCPPSSGRDILITILLPTLPFWHSHVHTESYLCFYIVNFSYLITIFCATQREKNL